jgi:hypothetical protein
MDLMHSVPRFSELANDVLSLIARHVDTPVLVARTKTILGGGDDANTYIDLADGLQHTIPAAAPRTDVTFTQPSFKRCGESCALSSIRSLGASPSSSARRHATLYEVDHQSNREGSPLWAPRGASLARGAVPVWLDNERCALPMRDETYHVWNSVTGECAHRTSLSFGARNTGFGRPELADRDARAPGRVIIAGNRAQLVDYRADADVSMVYGARSGCSITMLHSMPYTSAFLVGRGREISVLDYREDAMNTIAVSEAPLPVWFSSTFVTEHSVASWNCVIRTDRGTHICMYCQLMDLRYPSVWTKKPEWSMADSRYIVWVAKMDARPPRHDLFACAPA